MNDLDLFLKIQEIEDNARRQVEEMKNDAKVRYDSLLTEMQEKLKQLQILHQIINDSTEKDGVWRLDYIPAYGVIDDPVKTAAEIVDFIRSAGQDGVRAKQIKDKFGDIGNVKGFLNQHAKIDILTAGNKSGMRYIIQS